MCSCNKNLDKSLPTAVIDQLNASNAEIAKLGDDSLQKISDGKPLSNQDICPFCKQHKWYRCKGGCIITGQRL